MSDKRFYTRREAAIYLATSERRLDDLTKAGELLAKRDGPRTVKYDRAELDRYADALPSYEPAS